MRKGLVCRWDGWPCWSDASICVAHGGGIDIFLEAEGRWGGGESS